MPLNRKMLLPTIVACFGLAQTLCLAENVGSVPVVQTGLIDDRTPGWIWSGMVEYANPDLNGGTGHAGGPTSYGAFTFNGTSVEIHALRGSVVAVDGRSHRVGKLRVTIDGAVKAIVSLSGSDDPGRLAIGKLTGGNHVIQLQPEGGWAVVDYIKVDTVKSIESTDAVADVHVNSIEIPNGSYQLFSSMTPNKCLDVYQQWNGDGAPTQIWTVNVYNRQPNQWFNVSLTNSGAYRFSPWITPTKALTCSRPGADSTKIPAVMWEYTGLPSETWIVTAEDTRGCRISPVAAPELALSLAGGSAADGTLIGLEPWKGSSSQLWIIRKAN